MVPPRMNAPADSGPAILTAVPGRTKIPAPIIVPMPMVNAEVSVRSFASSSSAISYPVPGVASGGCMMVRYWPGDGD